MSKRLRDASKDGDQAVVKQCIKARVNLDEPDETGWTALMIATKYANIEIVQELIKAGANIDAHVSKNSKSIKYPQGTTALMIAAKWGWDKIVRLLIDYGADINAKDCNKMNALNYALKTERFQPIRDLIEAGSDLDIKLPNQLSPEIKNILQQTKKENIIHKARLTNILTQLKSKLTDDESSINKRGGAAIKSKQKVKSQKQAIVDHIIGGGSVSRLNYDIRELLREIMHGQGSASKGSEYLIELNDRLYELENEKDLPKMKHQKKR